MSNEATERGPRRVVWKFPVSLQRIVLQVPYGAILRHVGMDPALGCPALWYEVNTSAPKLPMQVTIYGTGHDIPVDEQWLGSTIDGMYVWHLYGKQLP